MGVSGEQIEVVVGEAIGESVANGLSLFDKNGEKVGTEFVVASASLIEVLEFN